LQKKTQICHLLYRLQQWSQLFYNRGPVNAWQLYRDSGALYDGSYFATVEMKLPVWMGKNRSVTCPESEWCHQQYTFCNFAARYQFIGGPAPVRNLGLGDHWLTI